MTEDAADLDRLSEEGDAAAEGRKPNAPAKPAAERGVEPPDPNKPPGDKPGDQPPIEPGEPVKISDLRTAYQTLKKKVKDEFEPKLQQVQTLEAKVKELESVNPPEVSVLQERLAAAEKRRDELETEIRFVDYSKSKEFADKYQKPYTDAWRSALNDLAELTVEDADGSTRRATQEDLLKLSNLPLGEARRQANALFGDSADDVMAHRRKIIELSNAQTKAIDDARLAGTEKAKLTSAERKAQFEQTQKAWGEVNAAIVKKWPHMFGPVEGDTEGNALLTKGLALADKLFSPTAENRPKSPEEALQIHAMIRNKVANHDRLALRLKVARERIVELESSLKEFEAHSPNGGLSGGSPGAGTKDFMEEVDAEIDAMDKQGRG